MGDTDLDLVAELIDDPEFPDIVKNAEASGTLLTPPVRAVPSDSSVYLSWEPPVSKDAFAYQIVGWETEDSENQLPSQTVNLPRATFTGLKNGVNYTFYVVSYGVLGNTVYSYAQATPLDTGLQPVDAPRLISSNDSSVTVSVRPLRATPTSGEISGYVVRATEVSSGEVFLGSTTETRRPVITVNDLQPSTKYELVYAVNTIVDSQEVTGPFGDRALTVITNDTTAVQNVTADAGNSQVVLSWDALEGATKYVVYYNEADDPYSEEGTVEVTDTSATITGFTNGTSYEFEVAAEIERDGELIVGDRSEPVFATPSGPAAPSDFRITHPSNGAMFFDWNPVSGVEGYIIYTELFDARGKTDPLLPDPVFIAAHAGAADAKVAGLTNDVEYRFRIASVIDGEPGKYTTDENSPLGVPMAVPSSTDPVVSDVTKTSIAVTYPVPPVTADASRATEYEVTFTPANSDPVVINTSETNAKAEDLAEGVTYTVSVRAANDAGYGPPSPNPIQVTTANKPGVVQNLSVTRSEGGTAARLTWEAPVPSGGTSEPSAYRVDASPVTAGDPDPAAQTVTGLSASFAGLAASGDYVFTVAGVSEAGVGPEAKIGSLAQVPQPGEARYDFDANSVSFSFAAPSTTGHQAQARARQQATPSDTALMAAIRDGKADQLIDNQLAVVEPSSLTCTDGTCTAIFDNFADNINGEAWVFQARFVDGDLFTSNWSDAAVTPVADAATATQVVAHASGAAASPVTVAGGPKDDLVADIHVLADGSSLVAGSFTEQATFGDYDISSSATVSGFIGKVASDGTWEWVQSLAGAGTSRLLAVTTTDDGTVHVGGSWSSGATAGSWESPVPAGFSSSYPFAASLTSDGNWKELYPVTGVGAVTSLTQTSANSLAVGGTIGGSAVVSFGGLKPDPVPELPGGGFVAALDPAKSQPWQWVTALTGATPGSGNISVTGVSGSEEGVFVAGSWSGTLVIPGMESRYTQSGFSQGFVAMVEPPGTWKWIVESGESRRNNKVPAVQSLGDSAVFLRNTPATSFVAGSSVVGRVSSTGELLSSTPMDAFGTLYSLAVSPEQAFISGQNFGSIDRNNQVAWSQSIDSLRKLGGGVGVGPADVVTFGISAATPFTADGNEYQGYGGLDVVLARLDSDGQWMASSYDEYFVKATFPWTPEGRTANGVVTMLVNGEVAQDGTSVDLGRCPGSVSTTLIGLAGSTSTTYELCN